MSNYSNNAKIVLPMALLIIILICFAFYFLLKNKNDKIKQIPFIIITIIILILELVKQIKSIGSYQNGSFWAIPLHFCSTFMFWFALASFFKGRLSEVGHTVSVVSGILFIILFYIDPHSIIGHSTDDMFASFFTFHTFFYHHLIILFVLLSVFLKRFQPKFNHILPVTGLYSLYFFIAITAAHLLKTNFTNLLSSNISFMQKLLDSTGYFVYSLVMYAFGTVSAIVLIVLGVVFIKQIKLRRSL